MQKGQLTEDKACINLGPGSLGARMETHQPPPSPVSLLSTVETPGRKTSLGGACMTL
jgi:hypothetical protein